MNKILIVLIISSVFVTSCGTQPEATAPDATQDVNALYTQAAETLFAEMTANAPTATTEPTLPSPPTATATLEALPFIDIFSWNYLASQTSGDVTVEVARVIIANKDSMEKELGVPFPEEMFQDKTIVVEVIYRITKYLSKSNLVF